MICGTINGNGSRIFYPGGGLAGGTANVLDLQRNDKTAINFFGGIHLAASAILLN
jgi:hypothetical protein